MGLGELQQPAGVGAMERGGVGKRPDKKEPRERGVWEPRQQEFRGRRQRPIFTSAGRLRTLRTEGRRLLLFVTLILSDLIAFNLGENCFCFYKLIAICLLGPGVCLYSETLISCLMCVRRLRFLQQTGMGMCILHSLRRMSNTRPLSRFLLEFWPETPGLSMLFRTHSTYASSATFLCPVLHAASS